MKPIYIIFILLGFCKCFSQNVLTIKNDGTVKWYNNQELRWCKDRTVDGIRIVTDSLKGIISEVKHKNGQMDGLCRVYHSNGLIREQGYYIDGLKDGKWYYWAEDGTLLNTEFYEKDKLVKSSEPGVTKRPDGTVSMVELIANNLKFDDEKVVVKGYFVNEKKYGRLFLSKGDAKLHINANSIIVDYNFIEIDDDMELHDQKFVCISGIFHTTGGRLESAITKISDFWEIDISDE